MACHAGSSIASTSTTMPYTSYATFTADPAQEPRGDYAIRSSPGVSARSSHRASAPIVLRPRSALRVANWRAEALARRRLLRLRAVAARIRYAFLRNVEPGCSTRAARQPHSCRRCRERSASPPLVYATEATYGALVRHRDDSPAFGLVRETDRRETIQFCVRSRWHDPAATPAAAPPRPPSTPTRRCSRCSDTPRVARYTSCRGVRELLSHRPQCWRCFRGDAPGRNPQTVFTRPRAARPVSRRRPTLRWSSSIRRCATLANLMARRVCGHYLRPSDPADELPLTALASTAPDDAAWRDELATARGAAGVPRQMDAMRPSSIRPSMLSQYLVGGSPSSALPPLFGPAEAILSATLRRWNELAPRPPPASRSRATASSSGMSGYSRTSTSILFDVDAVPPCRCRAGAHARLAHG